MTDEEKREQLRELYKTTFGKYPSGNTKTETMIRLLTNEGVDLSVLEDNTEDSQVEPKEEPKQEKPKEVKKTVKKNDEDAPLHNGMPVHMGQGARRQYLVMFRGRPRYWTHASIKSMRSASDQVVFPENTTYEDVADFNKCKSC